MPDFTLSPVEPFSLREAASFGFGPRTGITQTSGPATMSLAFVVDGTDAHAGVWLTQDGDNAPVRGVVHGEADPAAVRAQVARVLSIDRDAAEWIAAGARDPILGGLQEQWAGLRPVLFYSPYEAAAWSVLSQRRQRAQGMALRKRLSAAHGRTFDLPDGPLEAFPTPEALLAVTDFPSVEPERIERLHGVARAALDGQLDAAQLLSLEPEAALAALQRIKGLGPLYATLVLLRSTGATDIAVHEPHLASHVRHFYGLDHVPTAAELDAIAEAWRPFRTWAGVLVRAAGDRAGLPMPERRQR